MAFNFIKNLWLITIVSGFGLGYSIAGVSVPIIPKVTIQVKVVDNCHRLGTCGIGNPQINFSKIIPELEENSEIYWKNIPSVRFKYSASYQQTPLAEKTPINEELVTDENGMTSRNPVDGVATMSIGGIDGYLKIELLGLDVICNHHEIRTIALPENKKCSFSGSYTAHLATTKQNPVHLICDFGEEFDYADLIKDVPEDCKHQ